MAKLTKNQLEEQIIELSGYKGRHTELITVYISAGYDVNAVQRQLEAEKSTAKNIKSTATRKNVIDALEKIVRHLKTLKFTPENGLALFAGNISQTEGQDDLRMWDIEPPEPVMIRMYRCDKDFVLDPLKEMLAAGETYALLVMDRKEATIGRLSGKRVEFLQKMTSGVPSKVKAGGQSAQRFHRITEGLTKEFYKRIADEMKNLFYDDPKLKGILIGGPIPTKDEFVDGEYLMNKLQKLIIGIKDQGDTSESGLHELVENSNDILASQEITKEKKILDKFFESLGQTPDKTAYKYEDVKKSLEYGAVSLLLISKDLDFSKTRELRELAINAGTEIEMISTETEEGDQFNKLSGVGAFLRFKLEH
jgi:peptide chain release factor subunit 1